MGVAAGFDKRKTLLNELNKQRKTQKEADNRQMSTGNQGGKVEASAFAPQIMAAISYKDWKNLNKSSDKFAALCEVEKYTFGGCVEPPCMNGVPTSSYTKRMECMDSILKDDDPDKKGKEGIKQVVDKIDKKEFITVTY